VSQQLSVAVRRACPERLLCSPFDLARRATKFAWFDRADHDLKSAHTKKISALNAAHVIGARPMLPARPSLLSQHNVERGPNPFRTHRTISFMLPEARGE